MTHATFFYQHCQVCGRSMRVRVNWLGKRVRCGHCHEICDARDPASSMRDTVHRIDSAAETEDCDALPLDHSVLLVDDDRDVLELVSRVLTKRGVMVTAVHHPRMALEAITLQPYGVAVVDRSLPELDGIELMQRLKRYVAEIRVIVLSDRADAEDRRAAINAGAFSYLAKPCQLSVLIDEVIRAMPMPMLTLQRR